MMEDLRKNGQVSSRFSDFKGGVNLGLGTFNLVSILTMFAISIDRSNFNVDQSVVIVE